jgi:FixJ family two-component response regulator
MKIKRSLVPVIDDDEPVRESLPDLLNELGFESRTFSSAPEVPELKLYALGPVRVPDGLASIP